MANILEVDTNAFAEFEELTPVITPRALKAFGSISISAKPIYFCMVTLILSNLVYFLLMNQIFVFCKEKPTLTSQFLSCLVNGYCPVKQPTTFKHPDNKMNLYYDRRVFTLVLLIYGLTTTLLVLIPFLCYGLDLFLDSLPVLDELIRYNQILFSTTNLPGEFPDHLPATLIHAHIIFPAIAGGGLLIGLILLLAYQIWGQPSKILSLEDRRKSNL